MMSADELTIAGGVCECNCVRWEHVGICTARSTTLVTLELLVVQGERLSKPVALAMCEPCARDVRSKRRPQRRGESE
jgi:hypothetical protein